MLFKNIFKFILFFIICSILFAANPFTVKQKYNQLNISGGGFMPAQLIQLQGELKTKIVQSFKIMRGNNYFSGLIKLLVLAFIYGIFHAAGPGHRKTVVFAAFVARKAHFMEPAMAGLLLAFLHVLASIVLVFGIQLISGRMFGSMIDQSSAHLDLVSIIMLFIFILFLLVFKIIKLIRNRDNKFEKISTVKNIYSAMVISGLIPCPGATLILIFSASLGMYLEGIIAVAAMSLGMGITISLAGYLAYFGQEALFRRLQSNKKAVGYLSDILEITGLVIVLIFCIFLLMPLLVI